MTADVILTTALFIAVPVTLKYFLAFEIRTQVARLKTGEREVGRAIESTRRAQPGAGQRSPRPDSGPTSTPVGPDEAKSHCPGVGPDSRGDIPATRTENLIVRIGGVGSAGQRLRHRNKLNAVLFRSRVVPLMCGRRDPAEQVRDPRPGADGAVSRLWAATEALALGHGGIALVARATGMARSTISRGIQELESGEALNPDRARRPGGGRKRTIDKGHRTAGGSGGAARSDDPRVGPTRHCAGLRKVRAKLAAELQAMGHTVSHRLVAALLRDLGYTLQAHRKTREGTQHPDRDAQFQYLNDQVLGCQKRGSPVISVDTKRKNW